MTKKIFFSIGKRRLTAKKLLLHKNRYMNMSLKEDDKQSNDKTPQTESVEAKQKQKQEEIKDVETDEERRGVIPEDLDFKRFLGCGG